MIEKAHMDVNHEQKKKQLEKDSTFTLHPKLKYTGIKKLTFLRTIIFDWARKKRNLKQVLKKGWLSLYIY